MSYFHACIEVSCGVCRSYFDIFLNCQSSSVTFCFLESAHVFDIGNTCNTSVNNPRLTLDWASTDVNTGIISIFFI